MWKQAHADGAASNAFASGETALARVRHVIDNRACSRRQTAYRSESAAQIERDELRSRPWTVSQRRALCDYARIGPRLIADPDRSVDGLGLTLGDRNP